MLEQSVPFIDISRFEAGFLEKLFPDVQKLLQKTQFVGGPQVAELEAALAKKSGTRFAIGCANGTDALQIGLRALEVGPGDTVMIPDMTFWATFEAVVNVGAKPLTVDVSRDTLHLSLASIEEAYKKFKPAALILVHLYGWAAPETTAIREFCKRNNIKLLEDSAQAFGVEIQGQALMQGATLSTTSFYPAKVLGASGDAGALFTQDEKLAKRCAKLVNHGRAEHYSYDAVGWNSRIGVYESTFLLHSLPHLEARLDSRRQICSRYRQELGGLPLKFIAPPTGVKENGYLSAAVLDPTQRPAFTEYLKSKRIGFGNIYPGALSRQAGAEGFLKEKIDLGNADWVAKAIVNLPCYAYMRNDEQDYVINCVKDFFRS